MFICIQKQNILKNYNINVFVFSVVCEVLERLLQQRFIYEKNITFPGSMVTFATDPDEK